MAKLLQIDFPMEGPWGDGLAAAFRPLAETIGETPGLRWKIWTESEAEGRGGGIYLFDDEPSLDRYLAEHTERLHGFGITDIRALTLDINEHLTELNRGPVG